MTERIDPPTPGSGDPRHSASIADLRGEIDALKAVVRIAELAHEIPVGCGSYRHTGFIVELRSALDRLEAFYRAIR